MRKNTSEPTGFLNVDLDIYSKSNLEPLVTAMGEKVFVLHVGRHKRVYRAHLELPGQPKSADSAIRAFCRLIRPLPGAALNLWNGATRRDFNIGVQAGSEPHQYYEIAVAPQTLAAASDLNARIVLTVYAPPVSE